MFIDILKKNGQLMMTMEIAFKENPVGLEYSELKFEAILNDEFKEQYTVRVDENSGLYQEDENGDLFFVGVHNGG